ncbi:MAG: DUF917 domain-containing protein [Lachnospiraceae bacterium]
MYHVIDVVLRKEIDYMVPFELKTSDEIENFLTGCAFYGTGGGGAVESGRKALTESLEKGYKITALDPKEIRDDQIFCTAFFTGSIAPRSEEVLKEMQNNGYNERKYAFIEMLVKTVDNMEEYLGKKISGLFVAELGGSNSACCMSAAYEKGIYVIDGDCSGRAVPEMCHGLPTIHGKDFLPAVFTDSWGNTTITTYAFNHSAMERIGKMISQASYGELAEACSIMSGAEIKESLVPYTLSESLAVGRAIRNARNEKEDPCAAGAKAAGGYFIGTGTVKKKKALDQGGYFFGTYEIEGNDEQEEAQFKVWFKNENHIIWKNDNVIATSPDMIVLLRLIDGEPISNTQLSEGEKIGIVVVPARKQFLDPRAIKNFEPKHFGFDFGYVGIESNLFWRRENDIRKNV